MRLLCHAPVLATALLVLASGSAHAVVACVANELQLQAALNGASDGGIHESDDVEIHVVIGAYIAGVAVANQPFTLNSTHDTAVAIEGGYTADCAQRMIAPGQTVMDGANTTQVLKLRKTTGSISVDDLTIQRGKSSDFGAGLAINSDTCSGDCWNAFVSVTRSIMQDNDTTIAFCGGLFAKANHHVVFVANNLIVGNNADSNYGGACLVGDDGFNQAYDNTVVDNTTPVATAPAGGLYCGGTSPCEIDGNIFWSNTGAGLWLQSPGAFLLYNDYGSRAGQPPQMEIGALHVNPQFVDHAGGNFRLLGSSPLIGATPILVGDTDLLGRPRPSGGVQDIGAFEDTVFADGVEIVL